MAVLRRTVLGGSWNQQLAAVAAAIALLLPGCNTGKRPVKPASAPVVQETTPPASAPAAKPRTTASPRPSRFRIIEGDDGQLEVGTGQSLMLHLNADAGRVSIADPDVAEVILISPREVVINGKGKKSTRTSSNIFSGASTTEETVSEAQTSIIVWDRNGRADVRTLYVNRARSEQILLEVTIADINRTAIENYGFDFQVMQKNVLLSGTPSKIFNFDSLNPVLNAVPRATVVTEELNVNSDRLTYLISDLDNNFLAFIELLQRENMARILARPMILARSGEQAHFRVGGEVPVVYATQNVAQVNFKEFGVILGVTPTLMDDGRIDLRIATEVSEPSTAFQTAVVEGFQVPSFISRRAETRVTLRENEPLLIGGLYREDNAEQEDKVPYLGDIPFLGFFFRRTHFESSRNELLILVKPRVARASDQLTPTSLPTDRPPLSRGEVRTQQNPFGVTRPRLTTPPGPTKPVPGVKREKPTIEQYLPPQDE